MPFLLTFPYIIYLIASETSNHVERGVKRRHQIVSALANDDSGTSCQKQLTSDLKGLQRSNPNARTPIDVWREILRLQEGWPHAILCSLSKKKKVKINLPVPGIFERLLKK
jgi:hypothetical protein